ncbi:trypsin alpha-3 [Drosophila mojavensis]|uniref:trypsin n=1 Tax=Drosophila mojavensis TaxID=7230 RepID=B4KTP1_DROMO|nr:trypsin alpha-3 [Drosophila mojavensis]EDW09624.1 uncharacterized protein Dmoj_GI20607 [Drosophila mojavensis]
MFVKISIVVVLTSLPALAFVAVEPWNSIPPHIDRRVVGGSPAILEAYPWQVSLQLFDKHYCGGSLIEPDLVLTAAHCLLGMERNIDHLGIRAGSIIKSGGSSVGIKAFTTHPKYNLDDKMNDVALIRLKSKLELSNSIKTIKLASSTPKHGAPAIVSGWGTTSYRGSRPDSLLYINTFIVGRKQCASPQYSYGDKIQETMICAASPGKDACQGDSGGPLVSGGELVGVVSWGTNCAKDEYPGIYADVAILRDWIIKTAKTL